MNLLNILNLLIYVFLLSFAFEAFISVKENYLEIKSVLVFGTTDREGRFFLRKPFHCLAILCKLFNIFFAAHLLSVMCFCNSDYFAQENGKK